MSDKIIQLNEDLIKHDLKDLVRNSVEETSIYRHALSDQTVAMDTIANRHFTELCNAKCNTIKKCLRHFNSPTPQS